MVGAGVFVGFGPAAAAAGPAVLLSLLVAAVTACLCALSTLQVSTAMQSRPEAGPDLGSGGAVRSAARILLGPYCSFFAGWTLLCSLVFSAAVLALAFGTYVLPGHPTAAAAGAVVLVAALNLLGVRGSPWATRFMAAFVAAVLAFGAVVAFNETGPGAEPAPGAPIEASVSGVLKAAGLLFFLFAGFQRLGSLGPAVHNARRNLPLAVPAAVVVCCALYLLVGDSLLDYFGPDALAVATAPLLEPMAAVGSGIGTGAMTLAAAAATLGGLWAVSAAAGRTSTGMAYDADLPAPFRFPADPRPGRHRDAPVVAELLGAALVLALVLTSSLNLLIGLASFGLLIHAALGAVCAFLLRSRSRYSPRAVNALGAAGALLLALALPPLCIVLMLLVLAAGLVVRLSFRRPRQQPALPGPAPDS